MQKIVLGSSSKSRAMLLERLGIAFVQAAPEIDETPYANEAPEQLVLRLAVEKARALQNKFSDALIIAADQVAAIENTIFGKPTNHADAVQQLQKMSGKRVEFLTGLCVLDSKNQQHQVRVDKYAVIFRKLTLSEIENYLQKENVFSCAASFKIEGLGIALAQELEGYDYTALIGMSLISLTRMLEDFGVHVL